jgi:hypothetical protein
VAAFAEVRIDGVEVVNKDLRSSPHSGSEQKTVTSNTAAIVVLAALGLASSQLARHGPFGYRLGSGLTSQAKRIDGSKAAGAPSPQARVPAKWNPKDGRVQVGRRCFARVAHTSLRLSLARGQRAA